MSDNFNIYDWKFSQLINEGEGADLSGDMIKLVREKGNSIQDREQRDLYFERIAQAFTGYLQEALTEEEIQTISEEDDRCTRIAKSKYDVWPSAYASGAVVRCRKGDIWKDES